MSAMRRLRREVSKAFSQCCLKTSVIKKNGACIRVPIIHGVGCSNHMLVEERMAHFARVACELKSGLALDVGANVGAFLIELCSLQWFDRGGHYLGFEPNPLCAHYVNEISRLNSLNSADCLSVALTASPALPMLFGHRPADKMASLSANFAYREHRGIDFSRRVIGETGDNLLARIGSPYVSILKIDVEGHEGDVLAGLMNIVKASNPWIFCEMWDLENRFDGVTEEDRHRRMQAFHVLKESGYTAYDEQMWRSNLVSMDEEAFIRLGGTDVIFIPPADRESFEAHWGKV